MREGIMQEDILGPKYVVRLGDLRPWHVLQVRCFRCRHAATVSPAPLLQRYGEHQRVAELEDKTRCADCGNRNGNTVKVFKPDRNA